MIHIAIVEDEPNFQQQLIGYLHQYEKEQGEQFQISLFSDGLDVIEAKSHIGDIVLMDIQMRNVDGMKAAKRLRANDKNIIIIFITNLAQYALQGYKVDALDYILKPIQYFAFSQVLQKAVRKVSESKAFYIYVLRDGNMVRLNADQIAYIESRNHQVVIHTWDDIIIARNTLKNLERELKERAFFRCNNCYLVNLAYAEAVQDGYIVVAGDALQISRAKRKAFLNELAAYIGRS